VSGPTGSTDPYKVLQVDPEAEDEVISAAYRRLARKYHPDVATGEDSAARMLAINAAWAVIGDPARRAAYDRERATWTSPPRADGSTGSGSGRPPANAPGAGGSTGSGSGRPPANAPGAGGAPDPGPVRPGPAPQPESVSRDWSPGRSTIGGGFDPSMRRAQGNGAAGPPPGNPSGSVLNFGRYSGWSLAEIGRADVEYIEWLDRMPIGRPYRDEIDAILRRAGRRRSADPERSDRRGLFRRR
jgi:curved DNA-binding protein CbpA